MSLACLQILQGYKPTALSSSNAGNLFVSMSHLQARRLSALATTTSGCAAELQNALAGSRAASRGHTPQDPLLRMSRPLCRQVPCYMALRYLYILLYSSTQHTGARALSNKAGNFQQHTDAAGWLAEGNIKLQSLGTAGPRLPAHPPCACGARPSAARCKQSNRS